MKEKNTPARPFLKWAGGKGQLLDRFRELYPPELKDNKIRKYYEPFVGGGAVFFDVAGNFPVESAVLYDINEELILTYRVIQKNVLQLTERLDVFSREYYLRDQDGRKAYFYRIREEFNRDRKGIDFDRYSEKWIGRAAMIIFLNKTCYNGLFRFNSKGEFNTPAGNYKNPAICDEENLRRVSQLLSKARIKRAGFGEVVRDLDDPAGFVYFDPPYRPLSRTSNFTSYSRHEFGNREQESLAGVYRILHNRGAKLMLSNSDPKNTDPADNYFDDLYRGFNIYRVPATRMINSNALKRGKINEIVVTNY